MHTPFTKIQPLLLHLRNERLSRLLHTLLRRNIHRKPRLTLIMLLINEPLLPLVQPQKHYLRNVQAGVVLRNNILLGSVEDVLSDNGLDVCKRDARKRRRRGYERLDVLEEEKGGRRVA